jgi:hypothetical protein
MYNRKELESKKVVELKEICRLENYSNYSKLTKGQIIDLILSSKNVKKINSTSNKMKCPTAINSINKNSENEKKILYEIIDDMTKKELRTSKVGDVKEKVRAKLGYRKLAMDRKTFRRAAQTYATEKVDE